MISTTPEIRNEYYVSTETKKIWNVEMDLLETLMGVCEEYNLKCWVLAGTMLGAVRHKGFIPWDDDIDVALPRKDFDRLVEIAPSVFKGKYFLQTPRTDRQYYSSTIRLRNLETTAIVLSQWDSVNKEESNQGIFLDIFPLDGWPKDEKKQARLIKKVYFYNKLFLDRIYLKPINYRERIIKFFNKAYFMVHNYSAELDRFDKICSKYNGNSTETAYIARGKVKNSGYRYVWTSEETKQTIRLPFEDITVPVPLGYRSCLEKRYGDYMAFPPISERGKWHEDSIFFDPDKAYYEYASKSSGELRQLNKAKRDTDISRL